jgi:hypothetical protein
MLLTAVIVIPRSLSIAHAHSESWDDQYHLVRGLAQWRGYHLRTEYNDPPFGEMILATPMWVTGCSLEASNRDPAVIAHGTDAIQAILYGQPLRPETLLMLIAGWKAILFLPGAAVMFIWCRRLYGLKSAWLALAAVLADPTIAAHTAAAALDVLALEAVLFACYLTWRYFEAPHPARLIGGCAAIAAAISIKLTTVFVLPTCILLWLLFRNSSEKTTAVKKVKKGSLPLMTALLLVPAFVWAFSLFDVSRPNERAPVMSANYTEHWSFAADVVNANLGRHWPAGIYIASLANAFAHAHEGHLSYLMSEVRRGGWWYYQLIAAGLKIPVGMAVFLLAGIGSFVRRPRWAEWSLAVPFLFALVSALVSNVSIGFRHSIPWYVFAMMLASRCVQLPSRGWSIIAWCGVLAAAVHGLMWHPDELSYINLPWKNPQAIISDSNIDWGQSLKEIQAWLDEHRQGDRPVYAQLFIPDSHGVGFDHYLDGRVKWIGDALPDHGILIVSPVMMWGAYAPPERFAALRDRKPIAIIGHCIRVYDLDAK